MRKDIEVREVTELGIALIPEEDPTHGTIWAAHIVSLKDHAIKNVLVNVEGREIEDNTRRTATMRYLVPELPALSSHPLEVILPDVIAINNQFWISFSHNNYLYDKKIVVPHDAYKNQELVGIPVLHQEGLWFE